jgi:hypothetical protein
LFNSVLNLERAMGILDSIHEAQLHREVYIAILNSALQEPGSKRCLAEQMEVTQQYLSYLLNPKTDDPYSFRVPSSKVAEKIANALPLEHEQREHLLKHMYLARDCNSGIAQTLRSELLARPVESFLKELREADQEANFATDPKIARTKYLLVRDTCKMLLEHSLLYTYPLSTVEICMLLHDVQCILNRTEDALYHAKLARAIMEGLSRNDYRDKERFDSYQIRVLRAEVRAYSDLRLYRDAYEKCLEAEMSDAMRSQPEESIPQLYREKLQALCRRPRFALSEAEGLVAQVRIICDSSDNDLAPRWLFMANQYLVRAYLAHHNMKKAKKLLTEIFEQIPTIPHLGPLHQTIFLKTYARFRWEEGDSTEWEYFIKQALTYAVEAGLAHQISDIKRTYGQILVPLLKDLEASNSNSTSATL